MSRSVQCDTCKSVTTKWNTMPGWLSVEWDGFDSRGIATRRDFCSRNCAVRAICPDESRDSSGLTEALATLATAASQILNSEKTSHAVRDMNSFLKRTSGSAS